MKMFSLLTFNRLRHDSICISVFCVLFFSQSISALELRIPSAGDESTTLPEILLKEAVRRGGKYTRTYPYGEIKTLPLSTRVNALRNNEVDIFFALSTPEYEQEFHPVYIPIYRGMMGMRLAIVKKSNADLFAGVKNLSDLQAFTAGQGKLWADSKILEENSIPLVKELKYINLFRMLEADRFDYFPRGIYEPWAEVVRHKELDLVVDEHVMLWYKAPSYFFVNKGNKELADHLTHYLGEMVADGTFLEYFFNDKEVQSALSQANLSERVIVRLKNPFLTPSTPIDRKEFWFDPMSESGKKDMLGGF